jgi:acyl dehydratase
MGNVTSENFNVGDGITGFTRTADFESWNRFAAVNDEFIPIHMDDAAGQRAQYPSAIGMGNLQWAYLHKVVRDWIGERGRIVSVSCQFRSPSTRGKTIQASGRIVASRDVNGSRFLDLDVWIEDESGKVLAPGSATVELFND